jgi:hypothetical protein
MAEHATSGTAPINSATELRIGDRTVGRIEIDERALGEAVVAWLRDRTPIETASARGADPWDWNPDASLAASWVAATVCHRVRRRTSRMVEGWLEAAYLERRLLTSADFLDEFSRLDREAVEYPAMVRGLLHFWSDLSAKERDQVLSRVKSWRPDSFRRGAPRQGRRHVPDAQVFAESISKHVWRIRKAGLQPEDQRAQIKSLIEKHFEKGTPRVRAQRIADAGGPPLVMARKLAALRYGTEHGISRRRLSRTRKTRR